MRKMNDIRENKERKRMSNQGSFSSPLMFLDLTSFSFSPPFLSLSRRSFLSPFWWKGGRKERPFKRERERRRERERDRKRKRKRNCKRKRKKKRKRKRESEKVNIQLTEPIMVHRRSTAGIPGQASR